MTPTREQMRAWFDTFNRQYFNGELPLPRLALGNSRTRLGSMSCRRRRTLTGWRLSDFAIRLSTYYDCTEREMQTVLLHEMIHYYIAWKGIRDDAPHGSVFRSIMNRLNTRHGWDISVSASMRGRKTAAQRQTPATGSRIGEQPRRMFSHGGQPALCRTIEITAKKRRRCHTTRMVCLHRPVLLRFHHRKVAPRAQDKARSV